jgi:Chromo (CHRromatin Organisation MOdifier) domain
LSEAQERYKTVYDAHVKLRNDKIQIGDLVFVKTFVTEPGRSPKLEFPASGPFAVIGRDDKTFLVKTAYGKQIISSHRVTRAPAPQDLTLEFQLDSHTTGAPEDVGPTEVDRILAHGVNDDGKYMVKICWHAQDKSEDTWQEASDLPLQFIERYAKRNKLTVSDVVGVRSSF